jgi:hypothetical protein
MRIRCNRPEPVPEESEDPAVGSTDVDEPESIDVPVVALDGPDVPAVESWVPVPASSLGAVVPEDDASAVDVVTVSPGAPPSSPDGSEKHEHRIPRSATIDRGSVLTGASSHDASSGGMRSGTIGANRPLARAPGLNRRNGHAGPILARIDAGESRGHGRAARRLPPPGTP